MLWSSLVLAAREIRRNLFRSALTVLGVVIGVAAVIAIVTIGNGATARITDSFSSLGARLLIVSPGMDRHGPPSPGAIRGGGRGRPFTMEDYKEVRKAQGVNAAAPVTIRPTFVVTEETRQPAAITGTTADYFEVRSLPFSSGQWTTARGEQSAGCVVAHRAAEKFFGTVEAIGKEIDLEGTTYTVTGVLKAEDGGMFGRGNQADAIYVPIEDLHALSGQGGRVDAMFVDVVSAEKVDSTKKAISQLLRERREIEKGQRADFRIHGVEMMIEMVRQTTGTLTAVISSIAGISLLVGGIGIMNVMLVTITERTREIGVRMAIGAQGREVMFQFLVESSMLTAFGGAIGIGLGLAGGYLATILIELPFRPDPLIVSGVFLFSVALGLVFGFLPARRAARLNPIDALRHE
jgi:putative ABC transport system permease protein